MKKLVYLVLILFVACNFYQPVINYGHRKHRLREVDSFEEKNIQYIIFRCQKFNGFDVQCVYTDTFKIRKSK